MNEPYEHLSFQHGLSERIAGVLGATELSVELEGIFKAS